MNTRLVEIVGRLKKPRVFVLGDLILDKYVWGSVSRISPEAPVPVVNVRGEEYRLRGAARRGEAHAAQDAHARAPPADAPRGPGADGADPARRAGEAARGRAEAGGPRGPRHHLRLQQGNPHAGAQRGRE